MAAQRGGVGGGVSPATFTKGRIHRFQIKTADKWPYTAKETREGRDGVNWRLWLKPTGDSLRSGGSEFPEATAPPGTPTGSTGYFQNALKLFNPLKG